MKFVGTCCGVCANVSLGPEAPTVHIGACVADNITHLACGEPSSPLRHMPNCLQCICKEMGGHNISDEVAVADHLSTAASCLNSWQMTNLSSEGVNLMIKCCQDRGSCSSLWIVGRGQLLTSVLQNAGLCERWDALQGCWKADAESAERERVRDTGKRVRFLERIQSHISSVLGSEQDCRSSVHSQMQEPLLPNGKHLTVCVAPYQKMLWRD